MAKLDKYITSSRKKGKNPESVKFSTRTSPLSTSASLLGAGYEDNINSKPRGEYRPVHTYEDGTPIGFRSFGIDRETFQLFSCSLFGLTELSRIMTSQVAAVFPDEQAKIAYDASPLMTQATTGLVKGSAGRVVTSPDGAKCTLITEVSIVDANTRGIVSSGYALATEMETKRVMYELGNFTQTQLLVLFAKEQITKKVFPIAVTSSGTIKLLSPFAIKGEVSITNVTLSFSFGNFVYGHSICSVGKNSTGKDMVIIASGGILFRGVLEDDTLLSCHLFKIIPAAMPFHVNIITGGFGSTYGYLYVTAMVSPSPRYTYYPNFPHPVYHYVEGKIPDNDTYQEMRPYSGNIVIFKMKIKLSNSEYGEECGIVYSNFTNMTSHLDIDFGKEITVAGNIRWSSSGSANSWLCTRKWVSSDTTKTNSVLLLKNNGGYIGDGTGSNNTKIICSEVSKAVKNMAFGIDSISYLSTTSNNGLFLIKDENPYVTAIFDVGDGTIARHIPIISRSFQIDSCRFRISGVSYDEAVPVDESPYNGYVAPLPPPMGTLMACEFSKCSFLRGSHDKIYFGYPFVAGPTNKRKLHFLKTWSPMLYITPYAAFRTNYISKEGIHDLGSCMYNVLACNALQTFTCYIQSTQLESVCQMMETSVYFIGGTLYTSVREKLRYWVTRECETVSVSAGNLGLGFSGLEATQGSDLSAQLEQNTGAEFKKYFSEKNVAFRYLDALTAFSDFGVISKIALDEPRSVSAKHLAMLDSKWRFLSGASSVRADHRVVHIYTGPNINFDCPVVKVGSDVQVTIEGSDTLRVSEVGDPDSFGHDPLPGVPAEMQGRFPYNHKKDNKKTVYIDNFTSLESIRQYQELLDLPYIFLLKKECKIKDGTGSTSLREFLEKDTPTYEPEADAAHIRLKVLPSDHGTQFMFLTSLDYGFYPTVGQSDIFILDRDKYKDQSTLAGLFLYEGFFENERIITKLDPKSNSEVYETHKKMLENSFKTAVIYTIERRGKFLLTLRGFYKDLMNIPNFIFSSDAQREVEGTITEYVVLCDLGVT